MSRILTGIQSTNRPHLGNIMGAIRPMIQLSDQPENEAFAFIADLHSLTTVKEGEKRRLFVDAVAATWIACGFNHQKNTLYRQSDVPEVTELTWYLSCFAPYPMLANAHSFKDKSARLSEVNAGLFTYPVLMAADIIGYDAQFVPVGKDQLQHLEITRDIASSFNHMYGDIFVIPEAIISEEVMIVPGIDGQKMSKSYNNFIDVFLPEKELKKVVMSIVTDSKGLEEPKDADDCIVYRIYKLLASPADAEEMHRKLSAGGYGYGHAKTALFECIMDEFATARSTYHTLLENQDHLDEILKAGAEKARNVLTNVIDRVRKPLGFR